jgi:hypothetical protein
MFAAFLQPHPPSFDDAHDATAEKLAVAISYIPFHESRMTGEIFPIA